MRKAVEMLQRKRMEHCFEKEPPLHKILGQLALDRHCERQSTRVTLNTGTAIQHSTYEVLPSKNFIEFSSEHVTKKKNCEKLLDLVSG